jgi:hypothetical protein
MVCLERKIYGSVPPGGDNAEMICTYCMLEEIIGAPMRYHAIEYIFYIVLYIFYTYRLCASISIGVPVQL